MSFCVILVQTMIKDVEVSVFSECFLLFIQPHQSDWQQGHGQHSSPCNTLCSKRSQICQIWSFLGSYFSRYNFLIKNDCASKLIHCLYNRIKAIGNKAMVSTLAPATIFYKAKKKQRFVSSFKPQKNRVGRSEFFFQRVISLVPESKQ